MALAVSLACFGMAACDKAQTTPQPAPVAPPPTAEANEDPLPPPHVPREPRRFAPLLTRLAEGEHYDVDTHTETELCTKCHAEIVDQWRDSAHAFASLANPFFRVSFDQFVEDAGREKAVFCSGCHDPSLTYDGSIHREVDPRDRRAHVGVTCGHCHGVVEATSDGNASHTLSTAPIPIPVEGDPHSLAKHLARVGQPALRTNELCMSCHKNFLTEGTGHEVVIGGLDDATPFRNSSFAKNSTTRIDGGVEPANCVSCHMPKMGGPKNQASHRFAGGHSSLAAAIGSKEQLAAIEKMVTNAATLDVAAMGVGDIKLGEPPRELRAGDRVWADVVVFNENTGHHFPAGARDLRDTWIEVVLEDADGKVVARAGTEHERSGHDETAVKLHALLSSKMGEMVENHRVHQMRAPVIDRTIPPRDALVARYVWQVPEAGEPPRLPLTARAKLRHRRVHQPLHEKACNDFKTERGQAFAKNTERFAKRKIDPCVPQPIIEIAEQWAKLGAPERSNPDKPEWLRQYHRGLGLLHNVQETLPEAIEAFDAALEKLPAEAPKVDKARILFQLGVIAARQGRTQDAMDHWAKTEELVGEHPAIHFARGNAYQRVFRNDQATEWYEKAAKLVDDERVWRQLAVSAGTAGKPRVSYEAALAGLKHEQRDPHMLRNQMLALRKLEVDEAWVKQAEEAFSVYKRDEDAPNVRDRCSAENPFCREEREPMRIVDMR